MDAINTQDHRMLVVIRHYASENEGSVASSVFTSVLGNAVPGLDDKKSLETLKSLESLFRCTWCPDNMIHGCSVLSWLEL